MEQNIYKVFDKRNFTPVSIQNLSNYSMSQYEDDHIMEIKDESSCPARFFSLSGMKPYSAQIIPNGYSQLEASITKNDCTLSTYCGGLSQVNLYVNIHGNKINRKSKLSMSSQAPINFKNDSIIDGVGKA